MRRRHTKVDLTRSGLKSIGYVGCTILAGAALSVSGCASADGTPNEVSSTAQAITSPDLSNSCGYQVTTEYHSRWRGNGYFGEIELNNVSGPVAREYEVFADVGGTDLRKCLLGDCEEAEGGYMFTEPRLLKLVGIRPGREHHILFMSRDAYAGVTPYVVSINGVRCDQVAPQVSLLANQTFFTANGTLQLTANATDNVAVRKVVFQRDGVTLGVDTVAPYTFEVPADATQNGRHVYTAVAYDPSGNQGTSGAVRVLTGIGNKFFGTAPDNAVDYQHLLTYFNQLTPGNAGKWGSVEATRNQMDWAKLDTAYNFAKQNGLRFKLHTLIWGQQQPGWLASLSPEEQVAEIEQWMSLAAQRYPDSAMVDVVNEPLHAVPGYSAALGGAGATGWDWVIKSFEMARKYFPKAELLLNDYNIEAIDSATTDYLKIINLLKERGLIDGIGLQSHFLERAELSVIASNLDRLAATGLPIYVSELDVNFADDARQAQRMRDLFTLFWKHPSVLGVTHWGHLQGSMWRSDAYLIRSDGTPRPAMNWINCFRAGGTNCPVPEYVPQPRTGDKTGITLEAEDYDDARGVLALGDVVAYTDNADWQSFNRVVFDKNWDTLSVTYARGGQDAANVTVHLGSLDNPPVATVKLEPTGGWGTNKTVSVPFAPLSGEQNVFIRYNGGYGIGNMDRFSFGAPSNLGPNLIANSDFEANTSGWFSWGGVLSSSDQYAVSGTRSLRLSNRSGNGPSATSLTGLVQPGKTYDVSLWATVSSGTANINVTQKITCDNQTTYQWLINPTAVQAGQWKQLTGSLKIPDCNVTDVQIYAEGPAGGVDMYLDHVSVRAQQTANLVSNGTFESGTSGWSTYSGTASATTARAHSGSKSLLIGNRTGNAPAMTNITSAVSKATKYQVSFWVTIGGAATANVNLTRKIVCDGQTSYSWIANPVAVSDGQWVELKGALDIPNCTNLSEVLVYAEGPGAGVDLYVDDVSVVVPSVTNLLSEGTFESSASGWFTWGTGTLGLTQTRAHSGSKSLLLAGRTNNSPMARSLFGLVQPGASYQVSVWASISGAASANVNLTQKISCAGVDSYSWLVNPVAVADGAWVKLSGTLNVPNCNLTDAMIFAEGPPAGVDVFLDDAVVTQ